MCTPPSNRTTLILTKLNRRFKSKECFMKSIERIPFQLSSTTGNMVIESHLYPPTSCCCIRCCPTSRCCIRCVLSHITLLHTVCDVPHRAVAYGAVPHRVVLHTVLSYIALLHAVLSHTVVLIHTVRVIVRCDHHHHPNSCCRCR